MDISWTSQLGTSRSGTVFAYVLRIAEITTQDKTVNGKVYNSGNNAVKC